MPVHDWTRVDAGLYHDFHQTWIITLRNFLNGGLLPPDFFALAEQKIRGPVPDVPTLRLSGGKDETGGTSTALAVAQAPPRTRLVQTSERSVYVRKADRVTVRHLHGKIVSVIEIVSPGNKWSNNEMRAFVENAADLIQQGVHLLVIDLFPPTARDPHGIHQAIWDEIEGDEFEPPIDKPLTVAAYSAGDINTAYVEPFAVGDELPVMPLFLESERYIPLCLEETYRASWSVFPAALKGLLEPIDRPED